MLSHKDLWIKISDDFHAEINPILEQLENTSNQSYWFDSKSIQGKFFIIKNLLLSLNGIESKHYQLIQLINILELYKIKLTAYFNSHDIATCFMYHFAPDDLNKTEHYFKSLYEYSINLQSVLGIGYCFMIGLEIHGFPTDCSYKLNARVLNGEIVINQRYDPFPAEIEEGKKIGNPVITRQEQDELEDKFAIEDGDLMIKSKNETHSTFKKFAEDTHLKIIALLEDFETCTNLCKSLIEKKQKDSTPANLPEIERIYSVLINGYIKEPVERFLEIFQPDYSGAKIIWLKSGWELKYFVDRLNNKMNISTKINQWTDSRFILKEPVKNLVSHLAKQTTTTYYQSLLDHNQKSNLLYKLFKE